MLSQWLSVTVCNSKPVVVNHGVLTEPMVVNDVVLC